MTDNGLLDDAVRLHRQGRLQEAEEIYGRILESEPNHAGALHLLGVIRHLQGDHVAATQLIARAIELNPHNAVYRNNYGLPLHSLRRFPEALDSFRRALEIHPQYAQALANLGMAQQSAGEHEAAMSSFAEALKLEPYHADALIKLAVLLEELGRKEEAIRLYEEGIRHAPCLHFYVNLGAVLIATDRADLAVGALQAAIALAPKCAAAHVNLAMAHTALGHDEAALASIRRGLELHPQHVDALKRCAALLKKLGRASEAVPFYETAIAERPTAETHFEFGEVLFSLRQRDRAIEQYRRAIELAPELAEANFSLGNALKDQGKIEEAAAHYRRAVELKPDSAIMHGNLLFCEQYRAGVTPAGLAAAHAEWDRRHAAPLRAAWRPFDNDRSPHRPLRLGFVSCNFRQHPVGLFTVRVIEALKNLPSPPAPLPSCRVQQAGEGSDAPSPLAAEENPRPGVPGAPQIRNPKEISNLKFEIQNDGPSPPAPLPEGEGSRDCELVRYSDVSRPDAITERFMAAADRWVDTGELSDEQLAEQIRNDRIDILFDLGGHLGGNRLLVFARKPAPIQVKWVGYPGSAGLTAMDYLLADRWQVEAGGEAYCPEKVLRLPDGYVCFDPPGDAPEVGALPALQSSLTPCPSPAGGRGETKALTPASLTPGPSPIAPSTAGGRGETKALTPASLTPGPSPEYGRGELVVTFGSFNNPAKITPCVVAAWAEILRRVPGSRLLLKYGGFAQEGTRRWYEGLFASGGVGPERLELLGWSPRGRMLAEYNRVDLALDPFPYSGGITTCEALWMGVPVITLPGKTFAGRHSLSHLSNVGLTETVARDVVDYVELAVRLAHDLPRLAKWRAELRGQVARSPLCDGPRFAANLMTALRSIWQEWVAKGPIVP